MSTSKTEEIDNNPLETTRVEIRDDVGDAERRT